MELRNHTPFPAMVFEGRDRDDTPSHVLVLRVTLALTPRGPRLSLSQRPLVLGDTHHGDPDASSPRDESDLCPTRPATDVLVRGTAWSPGGVERASWEVSASVGPVSKRLRVTGPRWWEREGGDRWRLTEPLPCSAVPLRYELAYGGTARDGDREERCDENPIGTGFAPPWWRAGRDRVAAPQIESPDAPVAHIDAPTRPQGFGPLGRAWLPRRARAGTFDDAWLRERWPVMPADFDDAYWNAAQPELTAPGYLRGDEAVRLTGMHPQGDVAFALPGHYVFAVLRYESGVMLPFPMRLDAVTVDVDAAEVGMVYRLTAPHAPAIRVVEACMDFNDPEGA